LCLKDCRVLLKALKKPYALKQGLFIKCFFKKRLRCKPLRAEKTWAALMALPLKHKTINQNI
jgi:hypothetical protein